MFEIAYNVLIGAIEEAFEEIDNVEVNGIFSMFDDDDPNELFWA